jgi:hypothetical protein
MSMMTLSRLRQRMMTRLDRHRLPAVAGEVKRRHLTYLSEAKFLSLATPSARSRAMAYRCAKFESFGYPVDGVKVVLYPGLFEQTVRFEQSDQGRAGAHRLRLARPGEAVSRAHSRRPASRRLSGARRLQRLRRMRESRGRVPRRRPPVRGGADIAACGPPQGLSATPRHRRSLAASRRHPAHRHAHLRRPRDT